MEYYTTYFAASYAVRNREAIMAQALEAMRMRVLMVERAKKMKAVKVKRNEVHLKFKASKTFFLLLYTPN